MAASRGHAQNRPTACDRGNQRAMAFQSLLNLIEPQFERSRRDAEAAGKFRRMIRIQPKSRHALEPLLEKNPKFELRQVDTDAAMDADIERHVTLGSIWTKKIRLGKCLRKIGRASCRERVCKYV